MFDAKQYLQRKQGFDARAFVSAKLAAETPVTVPPAPVTPPPTAATTTVTPGAQTPPVAAAPNPATKQPQQEVQAQNQVDARRQQVDQFGIKEGWVPQNDAERYAKSWEYLQNGTPEGASTFMQRFAAPGQDTAGLQAEHQQLWGLKAQLSQLPPEQRARYAQMEHDLDARLGAISDTAAKSQGADLDAWRKYQEGPGIQGAVREAAIAATPFTEDMAVDWAKNRKPVAQGMLDVAGHVEDMVSASLAKNLQSEDSTVRAAAVQQWQATAREKFRKALTEGPESREHKEITASLTQSATQAQAKLEELKKNQQANPEEVKAAEQQVAAHQKKLEDFTGLSGDKVKFQEWMTSAGGKAGAEAFNRVKSAGGSFMDLLKEPGVIAGLGGILLMMFGGKPGAILGGLMTAFGGYKLYDAYKGMTAPETKAAIQQLTEVAAARNINHVTPEMLGDFATNNQWKPELLTNVQRVLTVGGMGFANFGESAGKDFVANQGFLANLPAAQVQQ